MPELYERRLKEITSLAHRKHRERLGQMLIEGVRSVESAVEAGAPLLEVIVTEAVAEDPRVQALLARTDAAVHVLPGREMTRLSDVEASQGVLAVARIPAFAEEELAGLRTILVLDAVQDPGNVGTLIRTAAWFGADAVVAGPGTVDFFNPKIVRAAMGGLWDVRLAQTGDLAGLLRRLSGSGFHCYGADLDGTPFEAWQPHAPSVLVLGSEAHGISEAVRELLDERVTITGSPHRRGAESLNVAVAAGILMSQWSVSR